MNNGQAVTVVCSVVQVVEVVEAQTELSLDELCRCGGADAVLVVELVEHGLLDPAGAGPEDWRFGGTSLALTRRAQRLVADLGVNAAGAAVVIELLGRIEQLERDRFR